MCGKFGPFITLKDNRLWKLWVVVKAQELKKVQEECSDIPDRRGGLLMNPDKLTAHGMPIMICASW